MVLLDCRQGKKFNLGKVVATPDMSSFEMPASIDYINSATGIKYTALILLHLGVTCALRSDRAQWTIAGQT